jgi:hypothetical protein
MAHHGAVVSLLRPLHPKASIAVKKKKEPVELRGKAVSG